MFAVIHPAHVHRRQCSRSSSLCVLECQVVWLDKITLSVFSHIPNVSRIIANSFNNDKTFQNVLNHSFESFINLSQRSPEYISLFMDDKLRKGLKSMNEDDVEGVLDRVMMLFRYLQDKDLFEKYYKQHLAKRLLSGRTVSHCRPNITSAAGLYLPHAEVCYMHIQSFIAAIKALKNQAYLHPHEATVQLLQHS